MNREYVFRLRAEADQIVAAHERAAAAADAHADQTTALARAQAAAKSTQDGFIASLTRQVNAIGKSRTELLGMQAAELGVADRAAPLIARLQAGERQFGNFARSGKLSALELQQVGFQLNDLAVQVASGGNPITALVQQGSQLSGTFGGIRPAIAAVASVVTPAALGVTALVGAVLGLGVAAVQGYRESRAFNDAIALTGNYAGQTAGQVDSLVESIARLTDRPRTAVRDTLQAVIGSGRIGPQNVEAVTTAVVNLQRFSGQAAEDIVKQFAGISGGVARWAAEQNKAYNFLTPKVYEQIRALEAQGKTQEAASIALAGFNDNIKNQTQNLGFLERAWRDAKKAFFDYVDVAKGIGRDTTIDDQLGKVRTRLQELRDIARGGQLFIPKIGESFDIQRNIATLETLEAKLVESRDLARGVAAGRSEDNERNQKAIEDKSTAHQGALASIDRAGIAQRLALAESAQDRELAALRERFDRQQITAKGYVTARVAIEQQLIAEKERALDAEIALERRRPLENRTDTVQQEAKLLELETRRVAIQRERAALAERARRGELAPERPRDTLGDFIRQQEEAFAERAKKRLEQAREAAKDLLQGNRELTLSLIADDRERGLRQIALEEEQLRRRIDLAALAGDERRAAEEGIANFVLLRNQQLTEQLKPEWQRQLELWEDYGRRRIQVNDEVNRTFVDAGRSAFGQMFVDGKFNIDNLASYALRTLGEQLFERLGFGRTFAQLGDLVFDGIESVVGGVAGDGRAAEPAPSAERDILRRMEAAAAEEIAQSVAETAASANETAATLATTNSLIALQAAAELAGESLLSIGAGGGDGGLGGLVGDLFGGSGGFLNDQGGTEVLGSLGFAKGAAFNAAGTVDRFARGAAFTNQVITKPTLFKFARGTKLGEMGEAGAEGIFPLGRTRSGELGVKMAGPAAAPVVQLNVEVVNTAPNARVRTEQRQDGGLRVLVEQIEGELGSRIDNGGGLLRNITQRTGVNGSAGLVL